MAHQVIISYSKHDKPKADAICNRLESQGIRCWIAPRDVPAGTEYADSIVKAIESSDVLVLVYSANADKSRQVRREVERAVSSGVKIVPVRIEDAKMSNSFEYYVGSIHWLDAITPPLEQHIDKLATELKVLLSEDTSLASAPTAEAGSAGASPTSVAPPQVSPSAGRDSAEPSRGGRKVLIGTALVLLVVAVAGYFFVYQQPPPEPAVVEQSPVVERSPVIEEPPVVERSPVIEEPPVVEQPVVVPGIYRIRSTAGCPDGKWCNAELSWDTKDPHPMASLEFGDPVDWELVLKDKTKNTFRIRSTAACPDGKWCNAELSWDTKDPHPMASLEFGDPVDWELVLKDKTKNTFRIRSKAGCPDGKWCNAELSWDTKDPHPMVSVERGDPVDWELVPK